MNTEQLLRELAQDEAAARVPAHVDAAVMAAWDAIAGDAITGDAIEGDAVRRAGARSVRSRGAWVPWAAAACGAVAVLVIAVSLLSHAGSADSDSAARTFTVREAGREGPPRIKSDTRNPAYVRDIPAAGSVSTVRRSRPVAPPPIDAGYVLVPRMPLDGASLTMMRVRMPRSALSNLGVPIANPDGDGLVDVDVLVGEDGVARSIRRAAAVEWPEAN